MKAGPLRWIPLIALLVGLCFPRNAQASAPVVSNHAVGPVLAGVDLNFYLSDFTAWTGNVQSLTYTITTQAQQGAATFPYGASIPWYCRYHCTNLNFVGTDTFVWCASSGSQTSGLATCSVTVTTNTPPVVLPCTLALNLGATNFNGWYLGDFVVDPDSGQTLTYYIRSLPVHGSLALTYGSGNAYFSYCASPGFVNGTDSFTWAASDGMSTSAPGTCTILLATQNTPPTAIPCTNTAPSYTTTPVIMPYTDPNGGQNWTALVMNQPAHGTAYPDPAQGGVCLDYCSASGFVGTDTFTFAICDGLSTSAPAVCTMLVATNLPVPQNQTACTTTNVPITIPMSYTGGGGSSNWPVAKATKSGGKLTTNGCSIVYTPSSSTWTGSDTFNWYMAYSNATTPTTLTIGSGTCTVVVKDFGNNTDWKQWRFDECRLAQSPAVLPNRLPLQWQRTLPPNTTGAYDDKAPNDMDYCRPVQMDKQLFVSLLANDSISAYNTETGAQNWRYYAGGALRRPPVAITLSNGTNVVVFGCDDGYLYCLNAATGAEYWKYLLAPNTKKAMGFNRLSSCWPIFASPVAYSNRIYAIAGYIRTWNLFGCCLDVTSGIAIWKADGLQMDGYESAMGPLAFSTDHTKVYVTQDSKMFYPWKINPANGKYLGGGNLYGAFQPTQPPTLSSCMDYINWFIDGTAWASNHEPPAITAGSQTFTPATVAALGVSGTVGSMLAGDGKLFVSTLEGNLYCFGTNVVQTNNYPYTTTPLPATNDTWTTVAQTILNTHLDLQQGLALVWGVGSGRLVEELAKQATNLMIVAADPDPAKLLSIRVKMDAAGWSGARVSTVQGNPMNCGFAPYQAGLIVSEDATVAGFTNGAAMAKMLYTCTRPFGGQIWLPTNAVSAVTAWLGAANLSTCNHGPSYQVSAQTIAGVNFTCIQRLGLPDANLVLKPPFRLTTFGYSSANYYGSPPPQVFNAAPMYESGGSIPAKGVKSGEDIYSWLPMTASESGYEPPVSALSNGVMLTASNYYCLNSRAMFSPNGDGVYNPMTNRIFGYLDYRPKMIDISQYGAGQGGGSGGDFWKGCSARGLYNTMILNEGKMGFIMDAANYWGILPMPESGACGGRPGFISAGNGTLTVAGSLSGACHCNSSMMYAQFGFVPTDVTDTEEQWVRYQQSHSMHAVQETPIRTIGINFGAPGDRLDDAGQVVWVHHPWFGLTYGPSDTTFINSRYQLGSRTQEGDPLIPVSYRGNVTNIYHHSGSMTSTSSNYHGWVSASHVEGMSGMTIPLAQPLVATRAVTPPVINGTLTDACWKSCSPLDMTTSCNSNLPHCYFMLCYDATNLYVAGVRHDPTFVQNPLAVYHRPLYMKVALGDRTQRNPPALLCFGEHGLVAANGFSTNSFASAFATNVEVFAGEVSIPWTNLVAAGIWTSQLVMNVEVCGDIFNYNHDWFVTGQNQSADGWYTVFCTTFIELAAFCTPVYFDMARGAQAEAIPHTVRLYFAETEGCTNGQRVFDAQLQGQTVLSNFDVYSVAGGKPYCEVIKEFTNVGIADKLNIDFVAHNGAPMLSGVEILTTGTNAANQAPVAVLDANVLSGPAPLTVNFSALRSFDPDGQIAQCAWDTGDGRVDHGGPQLSHIYVESGTYTATLLVLDNGGATATTNITVTVTTGVPAAFVCNIRTNGSANRDYTDLGTWASGLLGDLTSSTTVFQVSSKGTWATTDNLTGATFSGGKTGILCWIRTDVLNPVTNTTAAVIYVGGAGTITAGTTVTLKSGHTFTISDTGLLTTSLLFTVSGTGNYAAATDDNGAVLFPGGGTGILRHINHAMPNIAYITECRGAIQTGTVTCALGDTFTIGDCGHPVVTMVAEGYNDWPKGNTTGVTLPSGWFTDPNHCLVIRAANGQAHNGNLKDANGNYTGFALKSVNNDYGRPLYTRIWKVILDGGINVGSGSSVNRVLGSVNVYWYGVANHATVANTIGPVFSTVGSYWYPSLDVGFYNCTGGSFLLSDLAANHVRAVNCLSYSNTLGFVHTPYHLALGMGYDVPGENWLTHCVSQDNSATAWDAWKDGNMGNLAGRIVTFVNAATNDYRLAPGDTGARGMGQPGLGADISGNYRSGPVYDVGAYQTTNFLSAFQQWQMQYFGSTTVPASASNVVNSAGISNWQMFLAGSNPIDSNTWFRFTTLAPTTGSKWRMNFNTVAGKAYTVAWKTNLLDGLGWQFYTNLQGPGGSTQVIFTNSLPQAFFQIQAQ